MHNAQPSTWAIDPVHTKFRFDTKYLMLNSVSGWFREFEGTVFGTGNDFHGCEIQITIYTHSIFTGIEERDDHLRSADFFDAVKFPVIRFQSTEVTVRDNDVLIKGLLSIKDARQQLSFTANYLGRAVDPMGNTKAGFEMQMDFDRKDFNISWNQYFDKQGILLSDKVRIHADVQLLQLTAPAS